MKKPYSIRASALPSTQHKLFSELRRTEKEKARAKRVSESRRFGVMMVAAFWGGTRVWGWVCCCCCFFCDVRYRFKERREAKKKWNVQCEEAKWDEGRVERRGRGWIISISFFSAPHSFASIFVVSCRAMNFFSCDWMRVKRSMAFVPCFRLWFSFKVASICSIWTFEQSLNSKKRSWCHTNLVVTQIFSLSHMYTTDYDTQWRSLISNYFLVF